MKSTSGSTMRTSEVSQNVAVSAVCHWAERAVALILVLPLLPLFAATAVATWATVGRPLLFQQTRAGLEKSDLRLRKFRTMTDARASDGSLLPDRERETPITRLMRRTRIDELPQLLSIAKGEMSFVGPRPLLPQTVSAMGAFGDLRSSVRPGLAGWAQVNGNSLLSNRQKLALDLWYVAHKSVALDGWILLLTAKTLLVGERISHDRIASAERYVADRYPDWVRM